VNNTGSEYLLEAENRVSVDRPADLLTRSGDIATWKHRERLLKLLEELQQILHTDRMASANLPKHRDSKASSVYAAWRAVKDLADRHNTNHMGREVASELLSLVGLEIKPETAERTLRREDKPP
jgi:hypothetical protein